MSLDSSNREIIQRLDKIEKKLRQLVEAQPRVRKTWVPASVITELTGWDKEKMRWARVNGLIEFKNQKADRESKQKNYRYHLESLNPIFIKKQDV